MSMPSSRDAVATSAWISPDFSAAPRPGAARARASRGAPQHCPRPGVPQVHRTALGHAPRVHKHQRRGVLAAQLCDAVEDVDPHFAVAHAAQFRGGNLDGKVEGAALTDLHNRRAWAASSRQEIRHQFNRILRRRKADALRRGAVGGKHAAGRQAVFTGHQRVQPFQGECQWAPRLSSPWHGFRPRSPCARTAGFRAPLHWSAAGTATRVW